MGKCWHSQNREAEELTSLSCEQDETREQTRQKLDFHNLIFFTLLSKFSATRAADCSFFSKFERLSTLACPAPDPGWITHDENMGRHVSGDQGASPDNSELPNRQPREQDRSCPYRCTLLDQGG